MRRTPVLPQVQPSFPPSQTETTPPRASLCPRHSVSRVGLQASVLVTVLAGWASRPVSSSVLPGWASLEVCSHPCPAHRSSGAHELKRAASICTSSLTLPATCSLRTFPVSLGGAGLHLRRRQPSSVMDFHESITYWNLCSVGLMGPVSQLRMWSVKET